MAIINSHHLQRFYERYAAIDVTFTKEINDSLHLVRNQIYLKFKGSQKPCIIYSTSLQGAKVLLGIPDDMLKVLQKDRLVSLRFAFQRENRTDPLSFYIQSRIEGITQYEKEQKLYFVQLKYTQQPPDDLIEIIGNLLESSINSARRREERIIITPESLRKLGLASKKVLIFIDQQLRNCIIRDLSFGGAKVILMGTPDFLSGKEISLKIKGITGKSYQQEGKIIRIEPIEGRDDLTSVVIQYHKQGTSLDYKMIINNYLKNLPRKSAYEK